MTPQSPYQTILSIRLTANTYQATAIQEAGERSTLLNDMSPGYFLDNAQTFRKENTQPRLKEKYE
ncbi:hypothetical protein Hanom_Chr17g01543101 [Helianthus anomalus]